MAQTTSASLPIPETVPEGLTANQDRICLATHVAAGLSDDRRPVVVVDVDDVVVEALLRAGVEASRIHLKVTDTAAARSLYSRWELHGIHIDAGPLDQIPATLRTRYGDGIRLCLLWLASGGTFETIAPLIPPYAPLLAPVGKHRSHIVVTVADQRGNRALNNAENTRKLGQRLLGANAFDRIQSALRERHGRPYPWITDDTSLANQAYKEFSFLLHLLAVLASNDIADEVLAELGEIFKPEATVGPNSTANLREAELRVGLKIAERLTYLGRSEFRMATYHLSVTGRGGHAVTLPLALEAACDALAKARCGAVWDGRITILEEAAAEPDAEPPSQPSPSLLDPMAGTLEGNDDAIPDPSPPADAAPPSPDGAPGVEKEESAAQATPPEPAAEPPAPAAEPDDETPVSPPAAAPLDPTPACPPTSDPPSVPAATATEIETIRAKLAPAFQALAGFMPEGPAMLERLLALALVGASAETAILEFRHQVGIEKAALALAKRTHAATLEAKERDLQEARTERDDTRQKNGELLAKLEETRQELQQWLEVCGGHERTLAAIRAALGKSPAPPEPAARTADAAPTPLAPTVTSAHRPAEEPPTPAEGPAPPLTAETETPAAPTPQPSNAAAPPAEPAPGPTPPPEAAEAAPPAPPAPDPPAATVPTAPPEPPTATGNAALHTAAKAALPKIIARIRRTNLNPANRPKFQDATIEAVDLAVLEALCCHIELNWLSNERSEKTTKADRGNKLAAIREKHFADGRRVAVNFARCISSRQTIPDVRSEFRRRLIKRFPELTQELNASFDWALRSDREIAASLGQG